MAEYIKPGEVHSPKRFWVLVEILHDGGSSEYSLALGRWLSLPQLAIRWNGNKENPLGNPQSRGLPTWFILPKIYAAPILYTLTLTDEQRLFARRFLGLF